MAAEFRHELKYLITMGEYYSLRERLGTFMLRDEYAMKRGGVYHIRSLYFDDMFNSALNEKLGGVALRKKFRIRIYNHGDEDIKLEKKMKQDKYTAKTSDMITREECNNILIGNYHLLDLAPDRPVLNEFYAELRGKLLRPRVLVDYYREPYIYPLGNVRITFDTEIHTGQFDHNLFSGENAPIPVLSADTMVLEVKFDQFLPGPIHALLQSAKGVHMAISKYVLCRQYQ